MKLKEIQYPRNTFPCEGSSCIEATGHGTGLCEKCRTVYCKECKKTYVMHSVPPVTKVQTCAKCRHRLGQNPKKD